jgi:hypothetical protein
MLQVAVHVAELGGSFLLYVVAVFLHVVLIVNISAVDAEVTSLYCASTIRTAGEYNVSCNTNSFLLNVFGCASNGSTSPGVVSIDVLTSPLQILVSDSAFFFQQAVNGALADCIVHITYLGPVYENTPPVFVALTSHLRELRVTLLSTFFLGASFVTVRDVGAPNASIGLLSVVAGPQSSITCAGSVTNCNVQLRAAFFIVPQSGISQSCSTGQMSQVQCGQLPVVRLPLL